MQSVGKVGLVENYTHKGVWHCRRRKASSGGMKHLPKPNLKLHSCRSTFTASTQFLMKLVQTAVVFKMLYMTFTPRIAVLTIGCFFHRLIFPISGPTQDLHSCFSVPQQSHSHGQKSTFTLTESRQANLSAPVLSRSFIAKDPLSSRIVEQEIHGPFPQGKSLSRLNSSIDPHHG